MSITLTSVSNKPRYQAASFGNGTATAAPADAPKNNDSATTQTRETATPVTPPPATDTVAKASPQGISQVITTNPVPVAAAATAVAKGGGRFAQHIAEGLALDAFLSLILTALPGAGKLFGKKSLLLGAGLALTSPILLAIVAASFLLWKLIPAFKPAIQGALNWGVQKLKTLSQKPTIPALQAPPEATTPSAIPVPEKTLAVSPSQTEPRLQ
jgi:hypothetical protein